jgi:hypothetical protein
MLAAAELTDHAVANAILNDSSFAASYIIMRQCVLVHE